MSEEKAVDEEGFAEGSEEEGGTLYARLSSLMFKYAGPLSMCFAAAMLLVELGQGYLFNPWEPNYGGTVNEMLSSGSFFEPVWLDKPFLSKPIGLFWLGMPFVALFGPSPLALRLPIALSAIMGLFFVYRLGSLMGGRRSGAFAVLAGSTITGYVLLGRQFQMDMTTAALNVGVVALASEVAFVQGISRFGIRARVVLIYLFVAVSLLMKGLAGPAFAAVEILALIVMTRRWRLFLTFLDWRGILAFLIVGSPWFIYMQVHRPEFIKTFFIQHHFKRAAEGLYSRDFDWAFSVHHVGVGLAPWVALTPLIGSRKTLPDDDLSRNTFRIVCVAFCLPFLLFALQKTKFAHYFLPAYPFFAVLVGHVLDKLSRKECVEAAKDKSRYAWSIILALIVTGFLGMTVKDVVKNHSWPFRSFSPEKLPVGLNHALKGIDDVYVTGLWIFALGALLLLVPRSSRLRLAGVGALVLAAVIQVGGYAWWGMPKLSQLYSVRPLMNEILEEDPDAEFGCYASWLWESFGYQMVGGKGQIRHPVAAVQWLAVNPGHRYLFTEPGPARTVGEIFTRNTGVSLQEPLISRNERVVLGNRSTSLEDVIARATLKSRPHPARVLNAQFDDGIDLLGFDLIPEKPGPGEQLTIRLFFSIRNTPAQSWDIFVHMEKAFGARVAHTNRVPLGGAFPTTQWKPGTYVTDDVKLDLPDDLPPQWRLYVGLYNRTGRLSILQGPQDGRKRVNAGVIEKAE